SEIIIRAEINDLPGFAAVLDGGARISRSQKLRLVEFHRPCADVHPPGKTGRRLQRVAGLPSEKIAQAKFCGVLFVHSLWPVGRRGDRPYRGSHFSEDAARHKKFSQKPARFDDAHAFWTAPARRSDDGAFPGALTLLQKKGVWRSASHRT